MAAENKGLPNVAGDGKDKAYEMRADICVDVRGEEHAHKANGDEHVHKANGDEHVHKANDDKSISGVSETASQAANKKAIRRAKRKQQLAELDRYQVGAEINSMVDIEKFQEKLSLIKSRLPFTRLFILGLLAGWWLGLGVLFVSVIAGGIPVDVRNAWPMLPKLLTGLLFPVGISFISLFGGELFTGNSMSMLIGLYAHRITVWQLLYNWFVVLVSNFAGAVFTVYIFGKLTYLYKTEPWLSYVRGTAVTKINLDPDVAFIRSIAANALVCTCLMLGQSARDMIGKLAAMWFPILVFAATGFEHSIANMAYVPLGLMYGADADYRKWLYQNLLLVIAGNAIGGGLVVGGAGYFLYDWTRLMVVTEPDLDHDSDHHDHDHDHDHASDHHHSHMDHSVSSVPHRAHPVKHEDIDSSKVQDVFKLFDSDSDGRLDLGELLGALRALGLRLPARTLRASALSRLPANLRANAVSEARTDVASFASFDYDCFADQARVARELEEGLSPV